MKMFVIISVILLVLMTSCVTLAGTAFPTLKESAVYSFWSVVSTILFIVVAVVLVIKAFLKK